MKRSVFALALSMGIFTMHAQNDRTALEGTRPGDNWSIELKTGAVTPLTHSAFFKKCPSGFRSRDRKTTYSHFRFGHSRHGVCKYHGQQDRI